MADPKMLQFKMGEWTDGFDSVAKSAGTVYVTTNEKAMYVDIDDNTRIRISDIIQLDSAKTAQPPFSTQALYYFIQENALMKWNGTTWTQLNSVSDVTANLKALTTRVNSLENTVTSHTSTIGKASDAMAGTDATGLFARIEALEAVDTSLDGRLDTAETDITNLKSADTRIEGKVDKNTNDIAGLKSTTGTLSTDLTNLTNRVTTAEDDIDQLQSDVDDVNEALGLSGDSSSQNTAFGRIKKLEETDLTHTIKIKAAADKADANATDISGLKDRMTIAEGNISTNTTAISNLQEQIGSGKGLTGRIESLEENMSTAKSDITTLKSDLGKAQATIEGHTTKLGELENGISKNASDITNLTGKVNTNITNITNLQTANEQLEGRVEANELAIGSANDKVEQSKTGSLYARANYNADEIAKLKTRADNTETAVNTLNGDETVPGSVAQKIKQASVALGEQITSHINAANAMDYKGTIAGPSELDGKTNVKVGDTYVITSAFGSYTEGDLLVANGTETNGVITKNLEWQHVPTGYRRAHDPELKGANNAITLTSLQGAGDVLGSVVFEAATNSSATVSVANDKVTIGIEWGTF